MKEQMSGTQKNGGAMYQIDAVKVADGQWTLPYVANSREAAEREARSMASYWGIPVPQIRLAR